MQPITQSIRITNVYQLNDNYAAFSGVPLRTGSHQIKSTKLIVHVKARTHTLHIAPVQGQHWTVTGRATDRQITTATGFKITETHFVYPDDLECTLPNSGDSFALFIGKEKSFKGLTEDTARELWSHFGTDIYTHLENDNQAAFSDVLSPVKIKSLFKGFTKYKNLKHAKWFAEIGIPLHIQQRLLKYHDEKSVDLIKANPYILRTFGMRFSDVDRLALKHFSIARDSATRLTAAFQAALRAIENAGHTVAQEKDIRPKLENILKNDALAAQAFSQMKQVTSKKSFIYNPENTTYQSTATYIKEKSVALRIAHLATTNTLNGLQTAQLKVAFRTALTSVPFKLTLGQARAVYKALHNPVMVIAGGAGTGKTTVLKAVLAGYKVLGIPVHCAALSGRAAKRMHEATGYLSITIARLLRETPIEPNPRQFIKPGVLVLDEASMIDVGTMFRLINHMHPDTRILFVGDPNQLPPIDCGLVLRDVISNGIVTVTTLDIVKRQQGSTGIPEYSRYIAKGLMPPELSYGNVHFHCTTEAGINAKCVELYKQNPATTRITAAVYKKEHGGIDVLNTLCQQALNPNGKYLTFELFGQQATLPIRLNDPVIFTKNNIEAGVQNGTIGTLVSLANEANFGEVLIEDSGEVVELTHTLLESIKPAYCLSLHKAQGSQFPCVIIPINTANMIDRNWLYTAVTRAEIEVHIVGPTSLLEAAIERKGATLKRRTALSTILNSLH